MKEYIASEDVKQYELLLPLLNATYKEIQELSKKKPDSPLNNYKVKSLNRLLVPLKEFLRDEEAVRFLDILDSDDIPTNSDVILILSQYKKAMEMFHGHYYVFTQKDGRYHWHIK